MIQGFTSYVTDVTGGPWWNASVKAPKKIVQPASAMHMMIIVTSSPTHAANAIGWSWTSPAERSPPATSGWASGASR